MAITNPGASTQTGHAVWPTRGRSPRGTVRDRTAGARYARRPRRLHHVRSCSRAGPHAAGKPGELHP